MRGESYSQGRADEEGGNRPGNAGLFSYMTYNGLSIINVIQLSGRKFQGANSGLQAGVSPHVIYK